MEYTAPDTSILLGYTAASARYITSHRERIYPNTNKIDKKKNSCLLNQ